MLYPCSVYCGRHRPNSSLVGRTSCSFRFANCYVWPTLTYMRRDITGRSTAPKSLYQITVILHSVYMGVLFEPMPLFPALAGYCVGVLCTSGMRLHSVLVGTSALGMFTSRLAYLELNPPIKWVKMMNEWRNYFCQGLLGVILVLIAMAVLSYGMYRYQALLPAHNRFRVRNVRLTNFSINFLYIFCSCRLLCIRL